MSTGSGRSNVFIARSLNILDTLIVL